MSTSVQHWSWPLSREHILTDLYDEPWHHAYLQDSKQAGLAGPRQPWWVRRLNASRMFMCQWNEYTMHAFAIHLIHIPNVAGEPRLATTLLGLGPPLGPAGIANSRLYQVVCTSPHPLLRVLCTLAMAPCTLALGPPLGRLALRIRECIRWCAQAHIHFCECSTLWHIPPAHLP